LDFESKNRNWGTNSKNYHLQTHLGFWALLRQNCFVDMSCNYFYSLIVFYFFNISEFCDLKTIDNLKPGFNTRISRNRASRLLFDVFHTLHLEYEDCRVVHPSNLKKGVFELKSFQNFQSYYDRKIKKISYNLGTGI
jgi:hypothetical protein